jgi:hypothetical protein
VRDDLQELTPRSSLEAIEQIVDEYDLDTVVSLRNGERVPGDDFSNLRYEHAAARFLSKRYGPGTAIGLARFWRVRP